MKKRSNLLNAIGFFLAAIIIVLGVAIPSLLLHAQENAILGEVKHHAPDKKSPMSVLPTANIANEGAYNDLYARLFVWRSAAERSTIRDPYQYEISMEQAFYTCWEQIDKLMMGAGASFIELGHYYLESAKLVSSPILDSGGGSTVTVRGVTLPGDLGRWEIELRSNDRGRVQLFADAQTGKLLYLSIYTQYKVPWPDTQREMLIAFAKYHGLFESDFSITDESQVSILRCNELLLSCSSYQRDDQKMHGFELSMAIDDNASSFGNEAAAN